MKDFETELCYKKGYLPQIWKGIYAFESTLLMMFNWECTSQFRKPAWKIFSSDEQQFLFNLGQTILDFLRELLVEKIVLKENFAEIILITTFLLLYFETFHQFTFQIIVIIWENFGNCCSIVPLLVLKN